MNTKAISLAVAAATVASITLPAFADADHRARALEIIKRDFKPRGQAGVERLETDGLQSICNRTGNNPPASIATQMQGDQLATVKFPADGKLMGNWAAGEKLAQSGRGFTWTDQPGLPVGGNCYNCHQISPKEMSYGSIGPSLLHFGKERGNTPDMQKYVYEKIYNAKAFNLCSDMPRFGHVGALTPEQIKDLVALILDPESPVNK